MSSVVAAGDACVPNISPAERRKRLLSGVVGLVIASAILAVLILAGLSPWWRLALFPLFASATIGYFQSQDKT